MLLKEGGVGCKGVTTVNTEVGVVTKAKVITIAKMSVEYCEALMRHVGSLRDGTVWALRSQNNRRCVAWFENKIELGLALVKV